MTITDDLRQATKAFDRPAVPSVFAEYSAFMATGRYPYISDLVSFIVSRHDIPDDLAVNSHGTSDCGTPLSAEVYLASGQWKLQEMADLEARLLAEGYLPITELDASTVKRIKLATNGTTYRVVPGTRDTCLLPPRARTTGISLNGLRAKHAAFLGAKSRGQIAMDGPAVVMYQAQ